MAKSWRTSWKVYVTYFKHYVTRLQLKAVAVSREEGFVDARLYTLLTFFVVGPLKGLICNCESKWSVYYLIFYVQSGVYMQWFVLTPPVLHLTEFSSALLTTMVTSALFVFPLHLCFISSSSLFIIPVICCTIIINLFLYLHGHELFPPYLAPVQA